jgi:hypothetical protein
MKRKLKIEKLNIEKSDGPIALMRSDLSMFNFQFSIRPREVGA